MIPGVLVLTATPEQLGQDSHFARLRLLDPNRFHDLEAFRAESSSYQPVAQAVQELLDDGRLSQDAHETIHTFLGAEGEALLAAATDGDIEASSRLWNDKARDELLREARTAAEDAPRVWTAAKKAAAAKKKGAKKKKAKKKTKKAS